MAVTLKIRKLEDTGEFKVEYRKDGVLDEAKSYYTDDYDDAVETKKTIESMAELCEVMKRGTEEMPKNEFMGEYQKYCQKCGQVTTHSNPGKNIGTCLVCGTIWKGTGVESQITDGNVLEFKALTMTGRIYKQLREVKDPTGIDFLGYTLNEGFLNFVGKLGNTLVKVRNHDMDPYIIERFGWDSINERAAAEGTGNYSAIIGLTESLRDELPQIFVN